jgi:hypothetical protein
MRLVLSVRFARRQVVTWNSALNGGTLCLTDDA